MNREKLQLILVVDRDGETLSSLYSILDSGGYLVATVHPGINALRYVAEHKPDCVIAAKEATSRTGLDLIGGIRRISSDIRIIQLLSSGDQAGAAEALESGAHQLLFRPYTRDEVLGLVEGSYPAAHE
jgi:DNA-binding response OmpR family regulator